MKSQLNAAHDCITIIYSYSTNQQCRFIRNNDVKRLSERSFFGLAQGRNHELRADLVKGDGEQSALGNRLLLVVLNFPLEADHIFPEWNVVCLVDHLSRRYVHFRTDKRFFSIDGDLYLDGGDRLARLPLGRLLGNGRSLLHGGLHTLFLFGNNLRRISGVSVGISFADRATVFLGNVLGILGNRRLW